MPQALTSGCFLGCVRSRNTAQETHQTLLTLTAQGRTVSGLGDTATLEPGSLPQGSHGHPHFVANPLKCHHVPFRLNPTLTQHPPRRSVPDSSAAGDGPAPGPTGSNSHLRRHTPAPSLSDHGIQPGVSVLSDPTDHSCLRVFPLPVPRLQLPSPPHSQNCCRLTTWAPGLPRTTGQAPRTLPPWGLHSCGPALLCHSWRAGA